MARKYFGTDGIRGLTNAANMNAELAMRVGQAAGAYFLRGDHRHRVVIGKDTRLSGYMLESALVAGFTSVGMDVVMTGPLPTPAIAMLTHSMRADLGVMISASHNPYADNGIKLFGPDGFKLSDEAEEAIEAMLDGPEEGGGVPLAPAPEIGRARRIDDAAGRYIHFAKSTFPQDQRLDGLKVVIDCANGAAYRVAPAALWELGAELVTIGAEPNGRNINDGVGSTAPAALGEAVRAAGADIGIALDGDADRLIVVDEAGRVVDGDQLMATIAAAWARAGRLKGGGLVATVMSNLGLHLAMQAEGVALRTTGVGDRYVLEELRAGGFSLGGEQSGHVVLPGAATTGDGLLTALRLMDRMVATGSSLAALAGVMTRLPQVLVNVPVMDKAAVGASAEVAAAVAGVEAELSGNGRVLLRPSGTEQLVRVMVEAPTEAVAGEMADRLAVLVSGVR